MLRCASLGSGILSELDASGKGCIHLAAAGGHVQILQMLLSCKAAVDELDANGNTALMLASQHGRAPAAETLLEARANYTLRNQMNVMAVDLAATPSVREVLRRHITSKTCILRKNSTCAPLDSYPVMAVRAAHRIRLEGLPVMLSADALEGHVREFLKALNVSDPLRMEVAVNPITLLPIGHATIDYPEKGAAAVDLLLRSSGFMLAGRAVHVVRELITRGRF